VPNIESGYPFDLTIAHHYVTSHFGL